MEHIFKFIFDLISTASGEENAEAVHALSNETKLGFLSILERRSYPKGYILSTAGKVCDRVYIVESGLICNYLVSEDKETGTGFFAEGSIGGDVISFLTRQKSERLVKLIEPSILWEVDYAQLEQFYTVHPEAERIGRLLYNYVIMLQQQRIEDMVSEVAYVRYQKLISRFPEVIHRLPLNFTAGFLGITQETLSRIRAQK